MAPIRFDRREKQTRLAEDYLTPSEIAGRLRDDPAREQHYHIGSLLESGQPPVRYVREVWSDHVRYYTANHGARSLIVVFCGAANRPGVPVACFLQSLCDERYDVLLLQDPLRVHFDRGIPGIGPFLEILRKVEAFAESKGFTEIITYGSSMGGYPALRAGILLNATRAISMSGVYCWHIGRLSRGEGEIRAFDVLCPCFSPPSTELVAVVPTRNAKDMGSLEILRATFPTCTAVKIDVGDHSVPGFFLKARMLRLFFACLFDYWDDGPLRTKLISLVEQAAIHNRWVEQSQKAAAKPQPALLERLTTRLRRMKRSMGGLPWLRRG